MTREEILQYDEQGYLVLEDVLSEAEMLTLDPWFDRIISGEARERMAKDFCDMSQPYGTPIEEFQLVNAMLPSVYYPEFAGNIFQQVALRIARQLYSDGVVAMDYEQFLAKKPSKQGARFAAHQDLGYWPKTKKTWTATFSLAMNDADEANGCLFVIPGSNQEATLRKHAPINYADPDSETGSRDDSHTLVIDSLPGDQLLHLPVKRGSVTIHNERIVHGSGGNSTDGWRKTYIIAYRDVETIAEERAMGFTHSHNDSVDWKEIIT